MNRMGRMNQVLVLVALVGAFAVPARADVAVVVNKANPAVTVTVQELAKILKQERQHWEGGRKVFLVLLESGSAEKTIVLRSVYRMNDQELKQFWLGKIFRGEIAAFPKTVASSEAVKRFVSQAPDAVGFVDASKVDDSVKVLKLNGKAPGEPGYPLSGR